MFGIFGSRDSLARKYLGGQQPMQQAPQPQPQRNTMRRVAGYIGDALAGAAGQQGQYAASLERDRLMQERAMQDQQARAADYADFIQREQWKRDNPTSPNNDTVADYEFLRAKLGDEAAAEFLRNKANPPVYRVGPDGQFYRVDTATPPARPVGRLTPIEESAGSNAGGGFLR